MRSQAPFEPIVTKFCTWGRMGDVITDVKFYGNRFRGFGVTGPPHKRHFLYFVHRPYNSVSSGVFRGGTVRWPPLWPDHKNFLQATLYEKVRFLPFSSKNWKIQ